MSRPWDVHDFNDPDDDPVTRFRHLGGDYGPYDPAFEGFGGFDEFGDDSDDWDSDESFSHLPPGLDEFFEQEQKKYPRNSKDVVKRTPAGPMISLYDTRYFVPQWDEQMLGPTWRQKRGKWDFDNPPKPLPLTDPKMKGAFKYCHHCEMTWLVGYDKPEGNQHPHHLAWEMKEDDVDVHRWGLEVEASLVIFIHGACIPEGQPSKSPTGNTAGFGIFFGEGSQYNRAVPLGNKSSYEDAESAEIAAVDLALAIVKYDILGDREIWLTAFAEEKRDAKEKEELAKLGTKSVSKTLKSDDPTRAESIEVTEEEDDDDDSWEDDSEEDEEDDLDKLPFRIIIVSDKVQIVDNVCKHYKQWKEEKGKLLTKKGKPVKHGDKYQNLILSQLVDDSDTTVKWYCVPKDQNKEAMKLAMEALKGNSVRFTGEV